MKETSIFLSNENTDIFKKVEQPKDSDLVDSNDNSMFNIDTTISISDEFEIQSLAAVELFKDDIIVGKINPKVVFILGDKGTGKTNLANTLQLQLHNVKVIRDMEFSNVEDFTQFMNGDNLSPNLTIFDNLSINSFSSLPPKEESLCTNDLIEGVCRSLGITKLLIRTRRVLQRDIKSYFEESRFNENAYVFTNIFKGL